MEETPANHLPVAVAESLYASALRIGRAMDYDNAGTVEFVLDADQGDRPYFLEVNTRLQVEHAVTEMTTGIDLVEWQLRSAFGEPLPLRQEEITRRGWAIECRLNAEEPEHDYRASLGPLLGYAEPDRVAGVRIDSGLHAQSEVTPYYDSMLAKVIGFGPTRDQAAKHARVGLEQLRIEGVRTNSALLQEILRHPAFEDVLSTRFLEQHFQDGPQPDVNRHQPHLLAVAAAWAASQPVAAPVWGTLRSFRLTAPAGHPARIGLRMRDVSAATEGEAVQLMCVAGTYELLDDPGRCATVQCIPGGYIVHIQQPGEDAASVHIRHPEPQRWFSWAQGHSIVWDVEHELAYSLHTTGLHNQEAQLSAALPGRISEVMVRAGDAVVAGTPLLTLEAMKLYHTLAAPVSGVVEKVHAAVGDIVAQGQLLVEFEPEAAPAAP